MKGLRRIKIGRRWIQRRDVSKYAEICPDKRHKEFEEGVYYILRTTVSPENEIISQLPPSKIKRELEQLDKALSRISPDTQREINTVGIHNSSQHIHARILGALVRVLDRATGKDWQDSDGALSELDNDLSEVLTGKEIKTTEDRLLALVSLVVLEVISEDARKPIERLRDDASLALTRISERKKPIRDEARATLGRHAAAIWSAHGGKIDYGEFSDFVIMLIADVKFDDFTGKARADPINLVSDIMRDLEVNGIPYWNLWGPP